MKISSNPEMSYTEMLEAIKIMGFESLEMNFFRRIEDLDNGSQLTIYCEVFDDCIQVDVYEDGNSVNSETFRIPIKFIDFITDTLNSRGIEDVKLVPFDSSTSIFAKSEDRLSTREMMKKLIRVKSSNLWSYAFQPKDYNTGTMMIQFKGASGGPDDVYVYYDVPTKLWQKFVAAPSKGHFLWEYIRNVFKYSKLTGDKRTKLPNGI